MRNSIRKGIEFAPGHAPGFADQRWLIGAAAKMALQKVGVVDRFVGCGPTSRQQKWKYRFDDSEITPKARKNTHDDLELPLNSSMIHVD
jgi:hypothetical protein